MDAFAIGVADALEKTAMAAKKVIPGLDKMLKKDPNFKRWHTRVTKAGDASKKKLDAMEADLMNRMGK